MLIDYHLHFMSHDVGAKYKPEEYVKNAKSKGLGEIGFSDHFSVEKIGVIDYAMDYEELPQYVGIIQKLKNSMKFPIKIGLEMDFIPGLESKIEKITSSYPFDYVIGSVHFIGNFAVDVPASILEYEKSNINEVYEKYFGLVKKASESRLFDTIGHIDLIKIFGFRPKNNIDNLLESVAETLKENGTCVEVNTGGLTKPCKEIYPSKDILKMCFENGVPVTLGSDAHKSWDIGNNFGKAIKLLKEIGYDEIARFTRRKTELMKF